MLTNDVTDEAGHRKIWLDEYGIELPDVIAHWVKIQFCGSPESATKLYPSCLLMKPIGGDAHGFGSTLHPMRTVADPAARYRISEAAVFDTIANLEWLETAAPPLTRCAEQKRPACTDDSRHIGYVPQFVKLGSLIGQPAQSDCASSSTRVLPQRGTRLHQSLAPIRPFKKPQPRLVSTPGPQHVQRVQSTAQLTVSANSKNEHATREGANAASDPQQQQQAPAKPALVKPTFGRSHSALQKQLAPAKPALVKPTFGRSHSAALVDSAAKGALACSNSEPVSCHASTFPGIQHDCTCTCKYI
jgi:hypothetical protein